MKKISKLPSISRVTPGSVATLEIPLGPTYEKIIFDGSGTGLAISHIKRIRVLIDGKERQTYKDLQRLIDINSFWKREADSATSWALHFNRAELTDNAMRQAPGIGTKNLQTLHVEIEVDATAPADIKLKATALVDPTNQDIGAFFEVKEFAFASAVAGEVEQDKLPRGNPYGAIHLFKADVSAVKVKANGVELVEAGKATLERIQKGASPQPRVPVTAKATHIDFMPDGNLFDAIQTASLQDWRVYMTLDTAGSVDIVTETIGTL
jgi:hypothetical protein